MGRAMGLLGTSLLVAIALVVAGLSQPSLAGPAAIDLNTCAGATKIVDAASSVPLLGPVHTEKNRGLVERFLQTNTTTLTVGTLSSDARAGWSAPFEDPLTNAWSTTWSQTIAAPAIGVRSPVVLEFSYRQQTVDDQSSTNGQHATTQLVRYTFPCALVSAQTIPAATGGTLTSGDGTLTLTIPAGALGAPTPITVQPGTGMPPTALGTAVGPVYELGPSGTAFATPATLTLSYDPAALPAGSGDALHVVQQSGGVWSVLPSTIDTVRHTVTAHVRHFTLFGITVTPGKRVLGGYVTADPARTIAIPNVEVRLRDATQPTDGPPLMTTLTAADGLYAFVVDDNRGYTVQFVTNQPTLYVGEYAHDSRDGSGATAFAVAGADQQVDEGLAPGFAITGRVTDAVSTLPIAGASVEIIVLDPTPNYPPVTTAADGTYWVVVPIGTYGMQVAGPPAPATYVTVFYPGATNPGGLGRISVTGATPTVTVDQALPRGVRVSGHVQDEALQPVGDVRAVAFTPSGPRVALALTDASGNYSMVVPEGSWIFRFVPQGTALAAQYWRDRIFRESADPQTFTIGVTPPSIDATLHPAYQISGRVIDANARPVANAPVNASGSPGGKCCSGVAGTVTDANGMYALGVPAGTYFIRADGPRGTDLIGRWYPDASNTTGATAVTANAVTGPVALPDIVLPQGFPVSGTIVNTSNAPVAGVDVQFFQVPDANGNPGQFQGGTQTGADGTFRAVMLAGSYSIQLHPRESAPYYAPQWWDGAGGALTAFGARVVTVDATHTAPAVNATLQPGFLVTGRITDAVSGLPVPGAIGMATIPVSGGKGPTGFVNGGPADASGAYRYVVGAGTYYLDFMVKSPPTTTYLEQWWQNAPDFAHATPVTIGATNTGPFDAALVQGFVVTGRVTSGTAGVGGVFVSAQDANQPCCTWLGGAQTNADGTYRLLARPGSGAIKVGFDPADVNRRLGTTYLPQWWDGGTLSFETAAPIAAAAGATRTLDVALVAGFRISGTVTDAGTATPLQGVFVGANPVGSPCCMPLGGTQSGADGSFTVVVPAGTYRLWIDGNNAGLHVNGFWDGATGTVADYNAGSVIAVGPDRLGIVVRLAQGYLLTGKILDAAGSPIPQSGASAQRPPAPGRCCEFIAGAGTWPDGTFRLIAPAGDWIVTFSAPQPFVPQYWQNAWTPDTAAPVHFGPGQTIADVGTIVLQRGYAVTGSVTDSVTHAAIAGVNIGAFDASAPCCIGVGSGGQTDANGNYSILIRPGVSVKLGFFPNAPYFQQWMDGGAADFEHAVAFATTPGGSAVKNVALVRGSVIGGTITDSAGRPVANVRVNANPAAPPCCQPGFGGPPTDATGAFQIVVPAGQYKLWIDANGAATALVSGWYDGFGHTTQSFDAAATIGVPPDNTGVVIALTTGYRISGTVTSGGIAVAGAFVNLQTYPFGPNSVFAGAQTDSGGAWSVVVPAGQYALLVQGARVGTPYVTHWLGTTGSDPAGLTVITRNATTVTPPDPIALTLEPGVRISGRVSDTSGAGIANVGVVAQDATAPCCRDVAAWGSDFIGGGTDASGRWTLVVPSGSYKIVFHPGCCGAAATPYPSQYWSGKSSFSTADTLVVPSSAAAGSIDTIFAPPGWSITGTVSQPRSDPAVAVDGQMLYVIGGQDVNGPTATLQRYDAGTNTWTTLAPMPQTRYQGNGAQVINGKIYVPGGWYGTLPSNVMYIYDIAANSWSSVTMPFLSACGASGAIGGKLYVLTPCDGYSGYRTFLHVYDPVLGTWTALAAAPHAHGTPEAYGVIGGKLYVAGGLDTNGAYMTALDVFDPVSGTWTTLASMPAARAIGVGGVIDGKLAVAGGTTAATRYSDVFVYDPATTAWSSAAALPFALANAGGGAIGGHLYVVGGGRDPGVFNGDMLVFTP